MVAHSNDQMKSFFFFDYQKIIKKGFIDVCDFLSEKL